MQTITDLEAAVAAIATVDGSAIALIKGLVAQLEAVSAKLSASGGDASEIDALATNLTAQTSAFAAALTANTPSALPPSPPAPPAPAAP